MAKNDYVRIIALVIAFTAIFFSFIQPVSAKSKRLTEMSKLQENNYIIEFGWKEYKRYVIENPGSYQVIMYFTLTERCDQCVATESELKEVSHSYYKAGKHVPGEDGSLPIFFAKIEYTQANHEAFQLSQFTSVPIIALAGKEMAKQYKTKKTFVYPNKFAWTLNSDDFTDAGKLIEHINKITNSKVDIRYTMMRTLTGTAMILTAFIVLFLIKDKIASLIQNRHIWVIGSSIIFIQCIGGIAFTIIHSVPTFKYGHDESGALIVEEFIQRNQRGQYAGEGYICSFIIFLTAAALIGFVKLEKMKQSGRKEIYCLVLIAATFIGFTIINEIFIMKSPQYNPGIYPPDHYMLGPLSVDQGTNI